MRSLRRAADEDRLAVQERAETRGQGLGAGLGARPGQGSGGWSALGLVVRGPRVGGQAC